MPVGYVLRRVSVFFLVIWVAATINFAIPRLSPADPIKEALLKVTSMGASRGMEELIKTFSARFGLDRPVWKQYLNYLVDLAQFNLGYSISYFPARVGEMILVALPWTIVLVGLSTVITFAIGSIWRLHRRPMSRAVAARAAAADVVGDSVLLARPDPHLLFCFSDQGFPARRRIQRGHDRRLEPEFLSDAGKHAILRPCQSCSPTWVAGHWATPNMAEIDRRRLARSIAVERHDPLRARFPLDRGGRGYAPGCFEVSPKRPCACSMAVTISAAPKPSTTFARSARADHGGNPRPGKSRPAALPDCRPRPPRP